MRTCVSIIMLVAVTVGASRCASIVHGTTQVVPVNSSPTGAEIKVDCGKAAGTAGSLKTPTTVTLRRSVEPCNITLSKEGYEDASMVFVRRMSGWFWGNIFIGGIIGMIIDGADGAIYNRAPEAVSVSLATRSIRAESTEFFKGTKVYNSGALVGEVLDTTTDSVYLLLTNGITKVWIKKDQVSATPPAVATAPAPSAVPAPARAAATVPTPKPVPPALALGTKLFNPDGSPYGTVTILSKYAAAVLLANGYSTVTVSREQAVSMQR